MRIREGETRDGEAITQLLIELGWFSRFKMEQAEKRLVEVERNICECLGNERDSLYVAENDDGILVGYASVHWIPYMFLAGGEAYLSELFVSQGSRGQGIGKSLLDTVVLEARQRGCSQLSLITSRHRESYLRNFYKKQGWVEREAIANLILEL